MKKLKTIRLWAIILLATLFAGVLPATQSVPVYAATATAGSYYSGITATGGTALLGQLHDLITTTHTKYTSYSDCKDSAKVSKTDAGSKSGKVMEFYSQEDISSSWGGGTQGTWNREHVWCQSLSGGLWGESGGGSDMHHIRPVETGLNSARGSKKFAELNGTGKAVYYEDKSNKPVALGGYTGSNKFEPLDEVKGDVARIVMYVYTHYNTYSNVYGTTNGKGSVKFGTLKFTYVVSASNEYAAIDLLLKWNAQDPVDDIERARNDAVYKIQGNRNPFVDNSDYAEMIWGDYEAPEITGLSLSPATSTLTIGQGVRLSATASPSGAINTVTWASSNESVATVKSGLVTAKAAGTATITATSTENSKITATAEITVTASSSDGSSGGSSGGSTGGSSSGNSKFVTITTGSFDMTSGYSFKNWAQDGLAGIAFIYGGTSDHPLSENNGMQFNKKQSSYYLASTTAAPGAIKSVTAKTAAGKTARDWKLYTSSTAYPSAAADAPSTGTDHGTKTVTDEGVTWTIDTDDVYFCLSYAHSGTSGASYLESITVEYTDSDGGSTIDPTPTVGADFINAVKAIPSGSASSECYKKINAAIAEYYLLTDDEREDVTVASSYATLQTKVTEYNAAAIELNATHEKATQSAAGATLALLSAVAVVLALLKKGF